MARVSSKGSIVIPAELREEYGIKPGDELDVVDYDDVLMLVPHSSDPIAALRGMFKDGPSLTQALLDDRRWEKEREERKIAEGVARDLQRKLDAANG